MDRRSLATLAVGVLLVLSGCADVAVDATVDGDGTVESYETTIEMPPSTYDRLQSTAEDEGYGSVERYLLRGVNQSLTDDGNVTVDLRLSSWNPGPSSGVETTVEEGNVTFVDRSFVQNSGQLGSQSGYALTYTVTMPTNVTDSNADTVEGATATWRYDSDEAIESPIRAQSPVPDSGSGPGVGVVGTLTAVVLAMGLLARRT